MTEPTRRRCVVLGGGGHARVVIDCLQLAGQVVEGAQQLVRNGSGQCAKPLQLSQGGLLRGCEQWKAVRELWYLAEDLRLPLRPERVKLGVELLDGLGHPRQLVRGLWELAVWTLA